MAKSNRLRRKDIKKPDEFITLTGQVMDWLRANTPLAYATGAGLLAIVLGLGAFTAYRAAQQREANNDLAAGIAVRRGTDLAAAARDLDAAADRWRGTPPGSLALLLAANTAIQLGNDAAAAVKLEDLLAAGSLTPYLQQAALFALGTALEGQGKWPDAADKYAAAASVEGPYEASAILGEARARQQAGQADKANELYRKYFEQFPDAPEHDVVGSKIKA